MIHYRRHGLVGHDLHTAPQWASYQDTWNYGLRMRRECRERFSRHLIQRKPLVSDHGMDHRTCVAHVPWCMSGSLTGIPGACATRNFTYLSRGPWNRSLIRLVLQRTPLSHPVPRAMECLFHEFCTKIFPNQNNISFNPNGGVGGGGGVGGFTDGLLYQPYIIEIWPSCPGNNFRISPLRIQDR